ncbi:MAG: FtsW/RodA/SpoVE family cell cycle protein [Chitinivibrionia bacterium]|nr:FtsW/RodA/SpoVE family cell cycle protein [Chitinivibrionia bacterium]
MRNQEIFFTADGINKCDKIMLSCAVLLLITGIIFVFEADKTAILSGAGGKGFKQIVWSLAGCVFTLFFLLLNYKKLADETFLSFFLITLTVMLVVLAGCSMASNFLNENIRIGNSGFGIHSIKGAYRWIDLKIFNFQPSIFARVFLILFVAAGLSKIDDVQKKKKFKNKKENYNSAPAIDENRNKYKPLFFSLIIFVLVLVQPSTSVAISIMVVVLAMLALKNSNLIFGKSFFIIVAVLALAGTAAWHGFPHIRDRIVRGGNNYQSQQAILTIGSGGLLGLGLGKSEAKHERLPEIENDYIFSLIAEETGFVGSLIFMGIYILFVTRGFLTALQAHSSFARFAAFGFTVNYAFAFLVHLFVNLGFISTGASLPFVSYGGTAMFADCIALGILLNVSGSRYERIRI